ncbi:hypothetical protein [Limimaricola cinnabarinus]|uniref:Phage tail tape meausure protein, lambda family n=1 Tax=Limimaricola cinnabarinus LL-001 TaxID=1337093 RepID=U3ACV4_9RHOB|nr:hypothetical protein [Limimaricola cinnabarinus]GAD55494.1 phage tail tape meausure protein, lambda family [Limimaricola cinnabarinus LL-001]
MAQSVIGALRVNLGLDSAQFERGAKKLPSTVQTMRKQFMALGAIGVAAFASISAAALKGASDIDRAAKSARRLDGSIGAFRALEVTAGEAGVSVEKLADDIQTMNRQLANIGTSGNADRALGRLGISAESLQGLDTDEKVARIADRVKELGLSAGEATTVLQDLGIRNREMALLMIQGGDAIRNARADIDSYGLALNSVDAGKIESANDKIARLGLIGQYAGQQLALALVPAMGQLAQAMTDSLREGGTLRGVIDGLVGNLDRLAVYFGIAATALGVRYVSALVAARAMTIAVNISTLGLVGSLKLLRGAIMRTGFGALVIVAGELVYQFSRLVSATGGFGNALSLLGDIAGNVWRNMATTGQGLYRILQGVASGIGAAFLNAFSVIARQWDLVLNGMAMPFNALMGALEIDAQIGASNIGGKFAGIADEWEANALSRIKEGGGLLAEAAGAPLEKLDALRAATDAANEALAGGPGGDVLGGGGGLPINTSDTGGGGGKESEAAKKATAEAEKRAQVLKDLRAEHDKLRATINMTDLQAKIWNDTQEAGTTATSAQGQEITRLNTAIDDMTQAKDRASQMADTLKQSSGSAFSSIVTGASSAKDAIASLAQSLASMFADQAFNSIWGALAPSIPGAMPQVSLGSNASGTSNWRGGLTRVHELGGEIMNLPRGTQIIPHDISKRMAGGGGGIELILHAAEGVTIETVRNEAGAMIRQAAPGIRNGAVQQAYRGMKTQPKSMTGIR